MTTLPRNMYSIGGLVAACIILEPDALLSQGRNMLEPGARVRVTMAALSRPTVARFTGWRADSLLLDMGGGAPSVVPRTSLLRLEISRNRRSRLLAGAGVGLLVGGVATAAFLAAFCDDPDTLCETDEYLRAFTLIALPPTAVGAVIGLAIRVEDWEPVSLSGLTPGRDAFSRTQVGVSWRWRF